MQNNLDLGYTLFFIKSLAVLLTVIILIMFFLYGRVTREFLPIKVKLKTAFTGLIANIGDTVGIGSFAIIIAMRRIFKIMPDDAKLIGCMNLQAVVVSLVQALIFLYYVRIDLPTLIVSTVMIVLGGMFSSFIVVNIKQSIISKVMLWIFIITGVILFISQVGILKMHGTALGFSGSKLIIFSLFMFIAGLLPAFGVGYYSLIQVVMFIMGASPLIAFPIMATASAFQTPTTSFLFIIKKKFYFESSLLLIIFGTIGVFIAALLITSVNPYHLKWILFAVIVYNILILANSCVRKT